MLNYNSVTDELIGQHTHTKKRNLYKQTLSKICSVSLKESEEDSISINSDTIKNSVK